MPHRKKNQDLRSHWVIITGLSGSGKTLVSQCFEDFGYFCVDNLPVSILPSFKKLLSKSGGEFQRIALVIDVRERGFLKEFPKAYKELLADESIKITLIFLEASNKTLIKRFGETRRLHPLNAAEGEPLELEDAINQERALLAPIKELADTVLDSSELTVPRLRELIKENFGWESAKPLRISISSFGFKFGIPDDANLVFDVRFMPNPYYEDALRPFDGLHPSVKRFVEETDEYKTFMTKVTDLLSYLVPQYIAEGKAYLGVAFGCTAGKHRSVAVASAVAEEFGKLGYSPHLDHRDKDKE